MRLIERVSDRDVRRSLAKISALVEAAYGNAGVPTDTRFCLDQLAAEVRCLTQLYDRSAPQVGRMAEDDTPSLPSVEPAPRRDAMFVSDLGGQRRRPQAHDEAELGLTAQERRILCFIAEGCTNRQIATELFLAEKTVKNYVSNVLRKLGMERRTQAAVYAARAADNRPQPAALNASAGHGRAGPSFRDCRLPDGQSSPMVLP